MVAEVLATWPGTAWTVIHVCDQADGRIKRCRIWMYDELGPWMASACARAEGPVVLTLTPPVNGEYEVQNLEVMP